MLTSVLNKKVVAAVRLKKRALREEDRRFLVEGAQAVAEALAEEGAPVPLRATTSSIRSPSARDRPEFLSRRSATA